MDTKNINLMNDALFKAFMCHENTRELVVDFLHSLTGIEKELLRKGTFVGGEELSKRRMDMKKQMTDMNIRFDNKRRIIVEMNQSYNHNIFDKNTDYAFSVIVETTPKNVKRYPKVLLINIDNFNHFGTKRPILTFKIRDEEGNIESKMYESIHLVLANVGNPKYNIDKEIKNFANFLKRTNLEEMVKEYKGDERYMAAVRTVEDLTTDENLIGYYNYEEEKERELEEQKEYAREIGHKEGFEKGHEEGHKEGHKEGRKIGKSEGLKEGIKEGILQNATETAKKMLQENLNIDLISRCTGISLNQIELLQKEIQ